MHGTEDHFKELPKSAVSSIRRNLIPDPVSIDKYAELRVSTAHIGNWNKAREKASRLEKDGEAHKYDAQYSGNSFHLKAPNKEATRRQNFRLISALEHRTTGSRTPRDVGKQIVFITM